MISRLLFFIFLSLAISAKAEFAHEFISSSIGSEKIEIFWSKPISDGKHPLLILVHPHQTWPDKIGGEVFVKNESLKRWSEKGFVTVALSQPGYGKTDGSPDFCGEKSQQSVVNTIDHFKNMEFVASDKIFLYGGSRGAVISSIKLLHLIVVNFASVFEIELCK